MVLNELRKNSYNEKRRAIGTIRDGVQVRRGSFSEKRQRIP